MLFLKNNFFHKATLQLVILFFSFLSLNAQEQAEQEEEWVSTLLQSKRSIYMQLMQYGAYSIGWKYRGLEDPTTLVINGISWNGKDMGIHLPSALTGIYTTYQPEKIMDGFETSQFVKMNASGFTKNSSITSRYQPLNGVQQNNLFWTSGIFKKSWATFLKVQEEHNFIQNPSLGKRHSKGFIFSVEKLLSGNASIGCSFWYNQHYQTKLSPSTQDAIQLSGNSLYNPGWGWLHGRLIYPNARQSNLPIAQIYYSKKITNRAFLNISLALAKGKQSVDGLEWTSAKDPRPDYYKYLPSYYKDSSIQNRLSIELRENPRLLQIDFDEMEKINQSNKDGRSYYIISRQNMSIQIVKQATQFQYYWSDRLQITLQSNSSFTKIHNEHIVEDLLGGKYYLNYNSWVNDEGVDVFQFDINQPDRKIISGGNWGARYSMKSIDQTFGFSCFWQSAKLESSFGIKYGINAYQREGFNQNGLYPNSSLGISPWYLFPSNYFQWQALYKKDGRLYFKLNTIWHQSAPKWNETFQQIEMQDGLSPFLLPIDNLGLDFTIHYLGIYFKSNLSLYGYWQKNQIGRSSFYHDYYYAFVQGNYGLLNSKRTGIEWAIETNLSSVINCQMAISWGRYIHTNNPVYTIQLLNNAFPLESGNLHLKNSPASNSPQIVLASSVYAQLTSTLRLGLSSTIGWERYMELDYFRRSFLWETKATNIVTDHPYYNTSLLPNGLMTNFFCNQYFSFKSRNNIHRIKVFLQCSNLFNIAIPLFAYEQSRFDYKNFDETKFAPKYLYTRPLSGSIQIAYQIN